MPDYRADFASLMQRVCNGSQEAARDLVERYGAHIIRIIRRKLHRSLRPKFDSGDFVQAVWASFFALPLDQYKFDRSEALVAFLMALARNKVIEVVRQRLQSQKYNVNRERPLEDLPGMGGSALIARTPSAEEIAIARDEWDRLLRDQPAHYQQILTALRDGDTQQEAAQRLDVNECTVRRVLRKVASESADDAR